VKRCKPCGKSFRKGARVFVPDASGRLVGAIVCPACAGRAVCILPAQAGAPCACGEPAAVCSACADKAADKAKRGGADTKKIAKALRLRAKAYEKSGDIPGNPGEDGSEWADGLVAGLEQAADFLEGGAW